MRMCWVLFVFGSLQALPELDRLGVGGERVCFHPDEKQLHISVERPCAEIDWKSFSILEDERVHFALSAEANFVLNRVTGNAPSEILGHLESNGAIFLINPQGVVFGKNSMIDVGSLIVSTHNVNLEDILQNREMVFESDSDASIINLGTVKTKNGPLVFLAANIQNHGSLSAPNNQISLSAGKKIFFRPGKYPLLSVEVGSSGGIEHTGSISAARIDLQTISNPYSLGICLRGLVDATQVENRGGEIYLRAQGPVEIAENAKLQAPGGKIALHVQSEKALLQKGKFDAETIQIETNRLYQAGTLQANGGNIVIDVDAYIATAKAMTDVSSQIQTGSIKITASDSYFSSGMYRADGPKGGAITIDSYRVHFAAATLIADGKNYGGEIAIFSRGGHPLHVNQSSVLSAQGPKHFPGTVTLSALRCIELFGHCSENSVFLSPLISKIPSKSFQMQDPNPTSGASSFGSTTVSLVNGCVAVAKENDALGGFNTGAVYLFNGKTGALLTTLLGANANDHIGSGGIIALTKGNYIVVSPNASRGTGAVTWRSETVFADTKISRSNSFFGSTPGDFSVVKTAALANGNFVIALPMWDLDEIADVGAVTWINGANGADTNGNIGLISKANSICGSKRGDRVGFSGLSALTNGNCIIGSPLWNHNRGAATWMNGSSGKDALGTFGVVSTSNSLIGGSVTDEIASSIVPLSNGHALLYSPNWNVPSRDSHVGAVTWMNGTNGTDALGSFGTISLFNSGVRDAPILPIWDNQTTVWMNKADLFKIAETLSTTYVFGSTTIDIPSETFLNYDIAITEQFARTYANSLSGYTPPSYLSTRFQTVSPFSLITLKPWSPPRVTYEK